MLERIRFKSCHYIILALSLGSVLAGCQNELDNSSGEDAFEDHAPSWHASGNDLIEHLSTNPETGWSETQWLPLPMSHTRIGIRFDSLSAVTVEVRVGDPQRQDNTPWKPVTITFQDGIAHNAFADIDPVHQHFQVRFLAPTESGLSFASIETIAVGEHAGSTDQGVDLVNEHSNESALAADSFVITRSQWGARQRVCGNLHNPNRLTIHHTFTPNNDSISMAARVRQIQNFHIDVRGWCDVGYHFLVGQDGQVYQGRFENRTGAHAAGANTNNVGISLIGDFSNVAPSEAMQRATATAIDALSSYYGISRTRSRIKGHREVGTTQTSCPGNETFALLNHLIALSSQLDDAVSPDADTDSDVNTDETPEPDPSPSDSAETGSYSDLPSDHWAFEEAERLRDMGVLWGCEPGLFCPDLPYTRAEAAYAFAQLISSFVDVPQSSGFIDVPTSHWAADGILETWARGIIRSCSSDGFCPNGTISRSAMAVFLRRATQVPYATPSNPSFSDVPVSQWAYGSIEGIRAQGWTTGCGDNSSLFCPNDAVTRAEAAIFLSKAYAIFAQ